MSLVLKLGCPFPDCKAGFQLEVDDVADEEQWEDDCPKCERGLLFTATVLDSGAVLVDVMPNE